ncbi:unnamed protein product [Rhodiola kirilowii]
MESTDSTAGGGGSHNHPNLPPGFRFHPTDEELVVHYLKKKVSSSPLPVSIIAEIDLYKYDPWELPAKATFGEHEWYFFSPRDRKYPNGTRPNRAATSGYWKATGTDKPVMTAGGTQQVGVKKALVFYGGKPPKGVKTNWIMHEYRLVDNKTSSRPVGFDLVHKKNSLRLDDWVLCRIYKKSNTNKGMDHESTDLENSTVMDEMMLVPPSLNVVSTASTDQGNKFYPPNKPPSTFNTSALVDNEQTLYELGLMSTASHASSMPDQLASQSLPGPAAATNSFSLKRPLPHQHFYWLNGEQDQATIPNGPSSSNSSKRQAPHHVLQGDGTISGMVSLHSEAQQVPSQTTSLLNQFGQVGYNDFRQPYQLAGSLNWYPT